MHARHPLTDTKVHAGEFCSSMWFGGCYSAIDSTDDVLYYWPTCGGRDVTSERKPYPSFAPEDFPAVYKAAQAALKKAQIKAMQLDSTQARPHPTPCLKTLPTTLRTLFLLSCRHRYYNICPRKIILQGLYATSHWREDFWVSAHIPTFHLCNAPAHAPCLSWQEPHAIHH